MNALSLHILSLHEYLKNLLPLAEVRTPAFSLTYPALCGVSSQTGIQNY